MIITCIENCWIATKYYRIGDKINITERQVLCEHYNQNGVMYHKSKFLTLEELRDFKIKKIL
jgi:hypothetical protein